MKKQKEKEIEKKQANSWGHWTERKRRTTTLVCTCGTRYIKTRPGQTTCLVCMRAAIEAKK
ncbi:MAG TPA: hypothetical protein VHD31_03030 [Candidatus Paceibacterota bacterium]|nr:hypothetical protein [Candidatus Paceibacterota bacterium]